MRWTIWLHNVLPSESRRVAVTDCRSSAGGSQSPGRPGAMDDGRSGRAWGRGIVRFTGRMGRTHTPCRGRCKSSDWYAGAADDARFGDLEFILAGSDRFDESVGPGGIGN